MKSCLGGSKRLGWDLLTSHWPLWKGHLEILQNFGFCVIPDSQKGKGSCPPLWININLFWQTSRAGGNNESSLLHQKTRVAKKSLTFALLLQWWRRSADWALLVLLNSSHWATEEQRVTNWIASVHDGKTKGLILFFVHTAVWQMQTKPGMNANMRSYYHQCYNCEYLCIQWVMKREGSNVILNLSALCQAYLIDDFIMSHSLSMQSFTYTTCWCTNYQQCFGFSLWTGQIDNLSV